MGIVAIMYERIWEGAAPGPDGTEWDLTLDFNEDTGLFRVCGALDGEAPGSTSAPTRWYPASWRGLNSIGRTAPK